MRYSSIRLYNFPTKYPKFFGWPHRDKGFDWLWARRSEASAMAESVFNSYCQKLLQVLKEKEV